MKILVITQLFPNPLRPREGYPILREIKELAKRTEVKVIAPISGPFPPRRTRVPGYERVDGIDVCHPWFFTLPFLSRWLNGVSYFAFALNPLRKLRKTFDFDLIYAAFVYPDGFASVLLGRYFKKPVVLEAVGSDINMVTRVKSRKWLTRWALKRANKVVSVSEALKQRILEIANLRSKDVVVNYRGADHIVESSHFDREAFLKQHGLSPRSPVLLSIGHFIPLKEHIFLIDIVGSLKSPCQLVIVGDGKLRERYWERVKELGLDGRVKVLGPCLPDEMVRWYSAADILVHPSLSEGLPNVVLEAMKMSLPVVASRVGGLPEIIEHGENGFLFPPKGGQRLTEILEDLIDDAKKRKEIGRRGLNSLRKKGMTWNDRTTNLLRVFGEVLEKGK